MLGSSARAMSARTSHAARCACARYTSRYPCSAIPPVTPLSSYVVRTCECHRQISPFRNSSAAAKQQRVVNDFSIQVATVNGSGSQTANLVLLRSILLMGVPVSGKNMFPSNIAGLPTWYTIRASKRGYIARKKEVDFLVAMNAGDREGRRADARAGRRGRLRRAAEAQRAAQRSRLLSGAVRQARRAGLPGREAAPPRAQHDLRRHPREAARHRPGADGEGARASSSGKKAKAVDAERGRAQGRLGLRRSEPSRSRTRSSSSR